MLTIQRRGDLAVDYQASASVRWHLGQHPYIDPEDASIGPIVAIEDVSIEPGGVAHLRVPGETEELLYVVSGEVASVRAFHKGECLTTGTVVHSVEGSDRGWYKLRNQAPGRTARVVRVVYRPDRADLQPARSATQPGFADSLLPIAVPLTDPTQPRSAVGVHQDLRSWVGALIEGLAAPLAPGHALYAVVLSGRVSVDGRDAADGDGLRIEDEDLPVFEPVGRAELLVVVVPLAYPGELMWGDARYDAAGT
jgi:redox-sensitive bicupin YhaK (pirin superfamily)